MQYEQHFHLFNSSGAWIGFCLGRNVFDTDTVWRGWFPWDSADAVNTLGNYLGTVIGNRFYWFDDKKDIRVGYYPGYPPIPQLPDRAKPVAEMKLPPGALDVNLKLAAEASVRERSRQPGNGHSTRKRKRN